MHRKLVWLPVILLLILLWWVSGDDSSGDRRGAGGADTTSAGPLKTESNPVNLPAVENDVPMVRDPDVRQAFRFKIDAGRVTLEAIEDLRGKFRERRGEADWWPGMFCYRLLDDKNQVLAEETQPAPDHRCVVLDPRTPGPDGRPKAVTLTPDAPTIFQIRMPKDPRGATLKVYRLSTTRRAGPGEEPAGELLASIAIPR